MLFEPFSRFLKNRDFLAEGKAHEVRGAARSIKYRQRNRRNAGLASHALAEVLVGLVGQPPYGCRDEIGAFAWPHVETGAGQCSGNNIALSLQLARVFQ